MNESGWFERAAGLARSCHAWLYRMRRRLATGGVGVLACLVAYHVVFGHNGMLAYQQKRTEYRRLEGQIQQLQTANQQLSQQIKGLKSDPQAIEKEAREQLRYTRPGEVVYVLPADQSPTQPPPDATAQRRP